ncbi:MAG TPA: AAA family ATPase [Polyangia bacterium]
MDTKLVSDLLRPEAYPAPRPRAVTLRTTHISWVFLTEDAVYKVKRPVSLGFLDFSTPAARAHFCREEVRLNAALAPGVYLGVVPVWQGETGFHFEPGVAIVDHAVKMRRLPDDRSAAALLAAGQLTPEMLSSLAQRLADFYAAAPALANPAYVEVMTRNLDETLDELAAFADDPLDRMRLGAVSAAQRRDLARLQERLAQRAAGGKFREGHGDLRLEHVYFLEGEAPVVIDRLEFAERFRIGDIALDVAFLVMELEAAGAAPLAEYFLYRFARATGDFETYALIDFYACYRALVRAKIACLLAQDPGSSAARVSAKRAEATRLLGLAYADALGGPEPQALIAIGGLVGTGKSTLAEAIARQLGFPVISSDVARKQLAGLRPTDRGDARLYQPAQHQRTYDEIFRRADLVLAAGRSVVLDATFRTPADRERARTLAAAHGARFLFVETTCALPAVRERLRVRASAVSESDADEAVLDQTAASFVPPTELAPDDLLPYQSDAPGAASLEDFIAGQLLPRLVHTRPR